MRQTLRWLGHVCRMQIHRLPKLALFGTWIQNTSSPIRSHNHLIWIHTTLTEADIHPMDFFRLAQNTDVTKWEQLIKRAFPQPRLTPAAARTLNHWRSGRPLPDHSHLRFRQTRNTWHTLASRVPANAVPRAIPDATGTSTPLPTHPRHHGSRPHHLLQLPMQRMPQNLHHTPCTPQS